MNSVKCFNNVTPWYEPTDILRGQDDYKSLMPREDHAFLSGIIKQIQPKKIVEIGVAQGGTTALMAKTIAMLGLNAQIISVDIQKVRLEEPVGYIYEKFPQKNNIDYTLLLGESLAQRILKNEIGTDVDLVILDTTHEIPGEILDFLSILPYMSKNGMVVLHDVSISNNLILNDATLNYATIRISTKVLFSTVVAEKYYNGNQTDLPNIAAFSITQQTTEYINNVFYALTHLWTSQISDELKQSYLELFKKHYPEACVDLYRNNIAKENQYRQLVGVYKTMYSRLLLRIVHPGNAIPVVGFIARMCLLLKNRIKVIINKTPR